MYAYPAIRVEFMSQGGSSAAGHRRMAGPAAARSPWTPLYWNLYTRTAARWGHALRPTDSSRYDVIWTSRPGGAGASIGGRGNF